MKQIEIPTTITLDQGGATERVIEVSKLNDETYRLIEIYTHWRNQLNEVALEKIKLETALRAVEVDLTSAIHKQFSTTTEKLDTEEDGEGKHQAT